MSLKLVYFDGRGRAEPIRLLLTYAKVKFEDERLNFAEEEWQKRKQELLWGQLPVLEEDGKILAQTVAILRYLGRKHGLGGENDWENAKMDEYVDAVTDVNNTALRAHFEEKDEVKKASVLKDCVDTLLPTAFGRFNTVLKNNETGFLVGNKLSYADIFVAFFFEYLCELLKFPEEKLGDYPDLTGHNKMVMGLDGIKEWVEKRKPSPW